MSFSQIEIRIAFHVSQFLDVCSAGSFEKNVNFLFLVSMGMSPRGKALLMATAVLIDFLFFEDNAGYDSI